jgi:hypothetical protein
MNTHSNELYRITIAQRKMENLHIVFWLFKDIAWCMFWKPLGIAMIIPTMVVSLIITWRSRKIFSELCHNISISVWIAANAFWMSSEFFGIENNIVFNTITVKHLAMIPFTIGVLILGYYYFIYKPRHQEEALTL